MYTYLKCSDTLNYHTKHPSAGKPIDNNTRLFRDGDGFRIKYHNTDIVKIDKDGVFTIETGGWRTYTTKKRLNEYTPLSIYQKSHIWYLGDDLFFDGVRCDETGKVLNPQVTDELSKRKKLDKMIKAYIKGYIDDIGENGLGKPDTGDCFGCAFHSVDKGIVKGGMHENECMGFDHYISHFEEGYYVRSLLIKAIIEKGYNNPGFIWQLGDIQMFKSILQWFFNKRKTELVKYI